MMDAVRVLVTAAGGDLGQALVKSLRLMPGGACVVGVDIRANTAGEAFADHFAAIPPASQPEGWLEAVQVLCAAHGTQAIVPGCEPEMRLLAKLFPDGRGPGGAVIVAQPGPWFERHGDKLACMRGLAGQVDLAPFADGADREASLALARQAGFPLVVKPRRASGSAWFSLAHGEGELLAALDACPDPLVQGFIDEEGGGEFSVGVFACDEFRSAVAFRRELGHGGASWYADNADQDPAVLAYCLAVAQAAGLRGSCNVQVRKGRAGVRLLEINPRFSSLVAARAACGFRDLEWSLRQALGLPFGPPPAAFRRVRFLRFVHELVDLGQGFAGLDAWQPRLVRDFDGVKHG